MHTPEQLRLQLKQQQRRTRGLGLAHVAVYVAAVVLLLLRMEAPAMVLGAGNAILYFLFVRRLLTRYSQAVTNANLLCGLCQPIWKHSTVGMSSQRNHTNSCPCSSSCSFALRIL